MSTSTTQVETLGDNIQLLALVNPILVTRPFVSYLAGQAGLVTSLADLGSKIHDGTATSNDYIDVLKDLAGTGTGVAGLFEVGGLLAAGTVLPWAIGIGIVLEVWDRLDAHDYDVNALLKDLLHQQNMPELTDEQRKQLALMIKAGIQPWEYQPNGMDPDVNSLWHAFKNWVAPRRDPLVLDLDGDGIETLGVNATTHVVFDYDGDGVKTGTGWIKGDDGFVVLDRNGNGTIDNGGELFGDQTLVNGVKAADGFAALSAEDTNKNGKFDAGDTNFTKVRIWQDTNADGISQAGELHTLNELGVTSINLTSTTSNTVSKEVNCVARETALGCGNVQIAAGTYTKTNGMVHSNNQNFKNTRRVA
jgi:hypothetical protein